MDRVLKLSRKQRNELFQETASRKKMTPAVVEKDFWVCWVLDKLFSSDYFKRKILFKGGTSLSKVFALIERFSEDIDLVLNWDEVTMENPLHVRSNTQQDLFNKRTITSSREYLKGTFIQQLSIVLGGNVALNIQDESPDVINVVYPTVFKDPYLRPEIRLEIGPLASWIPNDQFQIKPFISEEFPHLFKRLHIDVQVIKPQRTFWEKVTILHQEAHRPEEKLLPLRYSRHYYDTMCLAQSSVKAVALGNLQLLRDVVIFKEKFYPCKWAMYNLAKAGSFALIPSHKRMAHPGLEVIMVFSISFKGTKRTKGT